MHNLVSSSFLTNLFIVFSSLAPCFGILFERISYLNNKVAFYVTTLFFSIFGVYLYSFNNIVHGVPLDYSRLVLFIYPITIVLFNIIFTYRFGFKKFAKTFSYSLMLAFLLTETREIANFFYEYTGFDHTVISNSFHPLTNLYAVFVGFLLFKRFNLNVKTSFFLVASIVLSSFIYYHFAYSYSFIVWIRLIQFPIFTYFFIKWGKYQ